MNWELLQLLYHLIQRLNLSITLTVFHGILFVVSQILLRRSKTKLQKEKAELTIKVTQLTGQMNYYKRQIHDKK